MWSPSPPARPEPVEGPRPVAPRGACPFPHLWGKVRMGAAPRTHSSSSASARSAKAHIFASRSALPVSSVTARSTGPETAEARVARGVAVAVARRAAGARLGERPRRAQLLAQRPGDERRVRLRARPHPGPRHVVLRDAQQRQPRHPRVRHDAAQVVGRRPRHRQQRRRDQPARRRIGHRNLLPPLLQQRPHGLRQRCQVRHGFVLLQDSRHTGGSRYPGRGGERPFMLRFPSARTASPPPNPPIA